MPNVNQVSTFSTDLHRKFIARARYTHVVAGLVDKTVMVENLPDGQGSVYNWPKYDAWTAAALSDGVPISAAQVITDTNLAVTPSEVGIMWLLTDKAKRQASENVASAAGEIAGRALKKKLDTDGIALFDGFSTSLAGTGVTLTAGHMTAAQARIMGATEPGAAGGAGPLTCMVHPYAFQPTANDLIGLGAGGANAYPIPDGPSAEILKEAFVGRVAGANIILNPNISIDSSNDSKGAFYGKNSMLLVWFTRMKNETDRDITLRGEVTVLTSDYAYGEANDAWGVELYVASTTPSS